MNAVRKYLRPEVLAAIGSLELRARLVVEGFVSGLQSSPYQGFSVEFAAHREYVPGDDVRHIDWRVYGKADRFYIKQYEEETNLRVYLLLDASRSMLYPHGGGPGGAGGMNKWEYAATLAASLGFLTTRQRDAVGLVLFDQTVRRIVPPSTSRAQFNELISVIAETTPDRQTDLNAFFDSLAEQVRRRSLVVVISDLLAEAESVVGGLRRLRHAGHDVIVLHVLDRDELEFPFSDHVLFEGMEEAEVRVLTDPQSIRRTYLRAVESFTGRIRSACLDDRIDYALMSTRDPLDAALTTFLARRMHRKR